MVDVPPRAILGGALRGTWRFEVTAADGPLPAAQIDTIRAWICDGALNN